MPGFDGTGPMGGGPMTGGARGYCATGQRNFAGRTFFGRGRGIQPGFGRGAGGGFRRRTFWQNPNAWGADPYPVADTASDLGALKSQAEFIKNELNQIQSRIDELEGAK